MSCIWFACERVFSKKLILNCIVPRQELFNIRVKLQTVEGIIYIYHIGYRSKCRRRAILS